MLLLIRTITRTPIDHKKPPHVSVAVLGSHSDHVDDLDCSLRVCKKFVDDDSTNSDVSSLICELRRFGITTSTPRCGSDHEISDPNVLFQKTYSGNDFNSWFWIVSYSVVRF